MDAVLIKLEDPSPRKRGEHRREGGEEDMALLEVRDLRTWFETDRGLFRAVDGISFDVGRGRTVGLVGDRS